MSFEDYATHILQKHKLATAIAILKTKPNDITPLQYIEQLKISFTDNMDADDVMSGVCSDDFDVDEYGNSETVLNEFNDDYDEDFMEIDDDITYIPDNLSQETYYESQESHTNITNNNSKPILNYPYDNSNRNNITIENNSNLIENDSEKGKSTTDETTLFQNDITNNKDIEIHCKPKENNKDIVYNAQNVQEIYTQNYTHYSQSQINMSIPKNLIFGTKKCHTDENISKNVDRTTDKNKNLNINSNLNEITSVNVNNQQNIQDFCANSESYNTYINTKDVSFKAIEKKTNNIELSKFSNNIGEYFNDVISITQQDIEYPNRDFTEIDIVNEIQSNPYNFEIVSESLKTKENDDTNNNKTVIDVSHTEDVNINETFNNEEINNIEGSLPNNDFEIEDSSQELVSFKILEELNKVKKFLTKDRYSRGGSSDGYSTDTGYRSDSQIRSSNRSALLSGTSINQSAHSLFDYLIQSHLAATRDITYEIAQVFGQLIDKLHEEEKYPTFLEDVLDSVDNILKTIFENDNSNENEFLLKEENIERLFLLNTSLQIQQHTIDKLTTTLHTFHTKITEKNHTYEQTNTNEIENISYIFHILEIILTKYIKSKDNTQSSQHCSQEDLRVLKKSSITDIWKKKWNPTVKNDSFDSKEKKCVLKYCSEVLNKIIVDCVNEFSLVSYSALKCFNLMQS